MLTLYHSGLSTCSKQVRHCLKEKGLEYESKYVELWNYENLNPEYLKLNPNGVVPTLVHDGDPIINALAINEYIDDAFPETPLKPADPKGRARMRFWTWTADDVHLAAMVATCKSELGTPTITVANAGVFQEWGPAKDVPPEEWDKVIGIDLTGVWHTCQLAGREMIANDGGSIVTISSIAGRLPAHQKTPQWKAQ